MPRPWRALDRAGATAMLAAAALLGAAILIGAPAPDPTVQLDAARLITSSPDDGRGPVSWLLTPRLVRGVTGADLFLVLRASDGARSPMRVRLETCAVAWQASTRRPAPRCPTGPRTLLASASIGDGHPVHAGRVATVDAGDAAHLLATFTGRSSARLMSSAFQVSANVTPCSAARADELWMVRRTDPAPQPNTVTGVDECATRPAPWLPLGLIALTASLVLRAAAHRIRRPT